MRKNIYVLKLEQNRFFIHFSETKSDCKILRECEIYYDYIKKYKPLSIIETLPFESFLDVDKLVKHYMYMYGYAYVRGGSYTEEELPPYLEKTLNHEFNNDEKDELYYQYLFDEILKKYEYNNDLTVDDIQTQINSIQNECKKFKYEKNKLEKTKIFFVDGEKYDMNYFFIEEIDWLYELCVRNNENIMEIKELETIYNSNYIKKYKKLLYYLKHIYYLFIEYDLFSKYSIIENTIYLKHPEFLFDGFMYNHPTKKNIDFLYEICKTFLFMGNVIKNILMEQEFDVCSYGFGYEWKVPKILYILETKKERFIHDDHIFIPNVD